jgi:hypothetical protein
MSRDVDDDECDDDATLWDTPPLMKDDGVNDATDPTRMEETTSFMVMICVGRGGSIDVGSKWKMIVRKKKYKIDLPVFSLRYVSLFLAAWYLSAVLGSPSTTQDIFFCSSLEVLWIIVPREIFLDGTSTFFDVAAEGSFRRAEGRSVEARRGVDVFPYTDDAVECTYGVRFEETNGIFDVY